MSVTRVCYVSGPYRDSRGEWFVHQNIEAARRVGRDLWRKGYAVIVPHSNTAMFGGNDIPDSAFIEGDLAIISRLDPTRDCMVMLPDWNQSAGAQEERDCATLRGIPVHYWPDVPEAKDE